MNIFDIIPGITGIIEKYLPDQKAQQAFKLEAAKLDLQDSIEGKKLVAKMVGHESLFVAGAIPAIIWLAVLYIVSNFVVFPILAGFGMDIAPLELPDYYWGTLKLIILCLFGKKTLDGNEIRYPSGRLLTPSKSQTEAAAAKGVTKPVGDEDYVKRCDEEMKKRGILK